MIFEVDPSIIEKASMCQKKHTCLSDGKGPYCRPTDLMRGDESEAALIECPKDKDCPYCHSFGGTHVCQCPVRLEIYKQYDK